eukprot:6185494-Pleurochrysis_carterae.AAC.5
MLRALSRIELQLITYVECRGHFMISLAKLGCLLACAACAHTASVAQQQPVHANSMSATARRVNARAFESMSTQVRAMMHLHGALRLRIYACVLTLALHRAC